MTRETFGIIREKVRQRAAALVSLRPAGSRALRTVLVIATVGAGLALALFPVRAFDLANDVVVPAVGFIVETLVSFLGQILLLVVGVLINVAQYNDFVSAPIVGTGWVIVRDVVNMFFIVVLLVMAFGTILGVQAYSIKGGNLTRLVIMAIVINFSRTLCGLMIDFGQVVMLTFVSGFKDAAGGNFVEAMKINEILQASTTGENVSTAGVVISLILALVMTAIATFVVIMMTVALTIRIVYLWLLIILSPIAFFLKAVPGGQASKAYADWWSKFTSNVLFGPVMAFFLWLSLVTVQQSNIGAGFKTESTGESISDSVGAAFNSASLQTFIIAVCLLVGGYQISMELGGSTTGMAAKARQGATSVAKRAAAQVSKRSGLDAYLAQRRAAKEETYKARGAGIAKGVGAVQLATGKVLGAPSGVIGAGLRRMGARRVGEAIQKRGLIGAAGAGVGAIPGALVKGGGRLVRAGGEKIQKAAAVTEADKAGISTRLQRAARWTGRKIGAGVAATGKGVEKVGGVTMTAGVAVGGMPGHLVEGGAMVRAGRRSQKMGRNYKMDETNREKQAAANMKKDEIMERAEGRLAGQTNGEQRGAILAAMDKKFVSEADLDRLRANFEGAGADPASMAAFDDTAKKNFPSWKTFAAVGEQENFQKQVDRGGLDLKGAHPDTVASNAESILKSPYPAKIPYEKQISSDPAQKAAYTKALSDRLKPPAADAPETEKAAWNSEEQVKFRQSARESMLRVDPTGAGMQAFGADPKTGKIAEPEAFTKAMSSQKIGDTVLTFDPSSVLDAKGEFTEMGKAMLAGLSTGELDSMARNSSGLQQEQLVRGIVEGIKGLQKGGLGQDPSGKLDSRIEQLKAHVSNSRSIKDRFPVAGGEKGGDKSGGAKTEQKEAGAPAGTGARAGGGTVATEKVIIEVAGGGGGRRSSGPSMDERIAARLSEIKNKLDDKTTEDDVKKALREEAARIEKNKRLDDK